MALGHVTSDHDLVSSHKLTRSGLSHKQRGNLWGKQQELWEEKSKLGSQGHGSLTPPLYHPREALSFQEGNEVGTVASGGRLDYRRTALLNKI